MNICRTGPENVQTPRPGGKGRGAILRTRTFASGAGVRCQLTRFQVSPPQIMPPKAPPCTRSAFGLLSAIVES